MKPRRRLLRILRLLLTYRLDTLLDAAALDTSALPWHLRLLWTLRPSRLLPQPKDNDARRLRLALEALGPVFIKFGQVLSTRKDLLPDSFAEELALLQDQVPPFAPAKARELLEAALGQPITTAFAGFTDAPLAAASVAQVHAANLPDGREVVVKIIRPDIAPVIQEDVALMHQLASLLERFSVDARRLHLCELVADYERVIQGELNLIQEGAHTSRLRQNFTDSPLLYVPEVYWPYTQRNVLVMERLHGVPIGRTDLLLARGTNMKLLAERGVETFFTQVFVHNFFHADMHPGNIFVDISDPASPKYMAIDCAIMGSLTDEDQDYLARNLLAFFHQDYREVARLHLESGWVPPGTDIDAFEAVISQVCAPIFARPLKEISFGSFLLSLFQAARQFNMEVQPQLVLLQKTLLNIEGLGRQLYPDLDLWQTAKPFMERWMAKRMGLSALLQQLREQGPALWQQLPRLPGFLLHAPERIKRLELLLAEQARNQEMLQTTLAKQSGRRLRWYRATGASLVLLAGWLWYSAGGEVLISHWQQLGAGTLAAMVGLHLLLRG